MTPEADDRFLNTAAAAAFTGYAPGTLKNWRSLNKGPVYRKDGAGGIRYRLADLRAFIEASAQTVEA